MDGLHHAFGFHRHARFAIPMDLLWSALLPDIFLLLPPGWGLEGGKAFLFKHTQKKRTVGPEQGVEKPSSRAACCLSWSILSPIATSPADGLNKEEMGEQRPATRRLSERGERCVESSTEREQGTLSLNEYLLRTAAYYLSKNFYTVPMSFICFMLWFI